MKTIKIDAPKTLSFLIIFGSKNNHVVYVLHGTAKYNQDESVLGASIFIVFIKSFCKTVECFL